MGHYQAERHAKAENVKKESLQSLARAYPAEAIVFQFQGGIVARASKHNYAANIPITITAAIHAAQRRKSAAFILFPVARHLARHVHKVIGIL